MYTGSIATRRVQGGEPALEQVAPASTATTFRDVVVCFEFTLPANMLALTPYDCVLTRVGGRRQKKMSATELANLNEEYVRLRLSTELTSLISMRWTATCSFAPCSCLITPCSRRHLADAD